MIGVLGLPDRGLKAANVPPDRPCTLDDWGFPIIRDADVPPGLQAEAGEAVRVCPMLALRLDRVDRPARR